MIMKLSIKNPIQRVKKACATHEQYAWFGYAKLSCLFWHRSVSRYPLITIWPVFPCVHKVLIVLMDVWLSWYRLDVGWDEGTYFRKIVSQILKRVWPMAAAASRGPAFPRGSTCPNYCLIIFCILFVCFNLGQTGAPSARTRYTSKLRCKNCRVKCQAFSALRGAITTNPLYTSGSNCKWIISPRATAINLWFSIHEDHQSPHLLDVFSCQDPSCTTGQTPVLRNLLGTQTGVKFTVTTPEALLLWFASDHPRMVVSIKWDATIPAPRRRSANLDTVNVVGASSQVLAASRAANWHAIASVSMNFFNFFQSFLTNFCAWEHKLCGCSIRLSLGATRAKTHALSSVMLTDLRIWICMQCKYMSVYIHDIYTYILPPWCISHIT